MDKTIIVFTSDHGEIMGAHGVRITQKQVPWIESAGVPLLISYPGLKGASRQIEMPLTTPDLSLSLLGLAGLEIPDSFEGRDFSKIIMGDKEDQDYGALYMSVASFASVRKEFKKEYRALKTKQYTYVKDIEGAWLLFDDIKDPYQMNNLANNPDVDAIQSRLDNKLMLTLKDISDDFNPAAYYINLWGYSVTDGGYIPYKSYDQEPQSPRKRN